MCYAHTAHSSDRRAPSFPRIWVEVCAATKEVPSAAPQHVLATMLFFLGIQSRATFQHLNSEGQDGGWKKKKLRWWFYELDCKKTMPGWMWKPLTVAIIRLSGAGDFWTEIFVAFLKVVFLRKHSNQYNFTTPWILLKERPFEDTHCDKTDFYVKQNIEKKKWQRPFGCVGNTSWGRGCVNEMLMGIKMRWWSGLGRQVYDRSTQKEVALDGLKAGSNA